MQIRVNPEMIILARESRGLTQKQLAEALKVEQYEISRMESGHFGTILDSKLEILSKLLSYPKNFFQEDFRSYPLWTNFYRKHKGLPQKELKRIDTLMNIYGERINRLMASVDVEYLELKDFLVEDFGSPEEVARIVRQYLRLPRGRIENMTEIIERFGIVIIPYNFINRKFSGASLYANTKIMFINEMPPDRWRFTLAHELGHLVMHAFPKPDTPVEEEADRFASEFLMPEADISQHLTFLDLERLASLKLYWKTAMSSILKRANTLGKISDRQYRSFWEKLGKKGVTRLKEPKELEPNSEPPTLLKEIVEFHISDLNFSADELAEKVFLDESEFSTLFLPQKRHLRLVS
jgi:Zn-dependent peptidase ImmA (M78 family)/DNA-binding XRE family transcriptional regulator